MGFYAESLKQKEESLMPNAERLKQKALGYCKLII